MRLRTMMSQPVSGVAPIDEQRVLVPGDLRPRLGVDVTFQGRRTALAAEHDGLRKVNGGLICKRKEGNKT